MIDFIQVDEILQPVIKVFTSDLVIALDEKEAKLFHNRSEYADYLACKALSFWFEYVHDQIKNDVYQWIINSEGDE